MADYHTHTILSCGNDINRRHAKNTIEENVQVAISKGIQRIGISEHGFFHKYYGLSKENAKYEREEIDRLNEKYPEIEILMGMECNILDDKGNIDMPDDMLDYFDYVLAGYHFGLMPRSFRGLLNLSDNFIFGGRFSKKYNTKAVINAMKNNKLLYITHPGDKGMVDIEEVAEAAINTNTGLEINGYHNRLSAEMIEKIKDRDISFYIGSDAHRAKDVGNFEKALEIVKRSGLDMGRIKNIESV